MARETLSKMGSHYGPQGEWKKLEGTCVDKVSGE
jgi:protein kinase C substrate 80K-H